jgi:replicative DNA helicase
MNASPTNQAETENYIARQLLSTLWMCPDYIPLAAQILSHDGLLLPTAEYVWQIIKSHVGNGKLDIPRALDAIHRKQDAAEFFRQAQEENYSPKRFGERKITQWASTLAEQGLRRLGAGIAEKAKAAMMSSAAPLDETVSTAMQELAGLRSRGGMNTWRSQNDIMVDSLKILEAMERGEVADGVMTGFPSIDFVLSGGFPNGELILIGAKPSMGKTAASLEIAMNMGFQWEREGSDKCVAYFSAETTSTKLQLRMACSLARVNQAKLRAGRATYEEKQALRDALERVRTLPIYIDEGVRPTTQQMLLRAMALDNVAIDGKQKKVGIIFFDFLELAGDEDANEVLRVGKIANGLKDLAKSLMVPVVALSQVGKAVDGRMPTLNDLRWSATLEQLPYIIMFLHRESYYKKRKDLDYNPLFDDDHGKSVWMIAKQKDGATGPVEMCFEEEFAKFSDPRAKNGW